jgi:cell division protein FtsB
MKNTGLNINKRQLVLTGLLVLFAYLMMDLNSRLAVLSQLSTQSAESRKEYNQLLITRMSLQTQIAYTTSEAAVDDYARDKAHLARPGDVVIVPLPGGEVTQTPEEVVVPTIQPVENWQVWKALLLGH